VSLAEATERVEDRDLTRLLTGLADNDGAALHSVLAELDAGGEDASVFDPATR
jgi:hypothetical protein